MELLLKKKSIKKEKNNTTDSPHDDGFVLEDERMIKADLYIREDDHNMDK